MLIFDPCRQATVRAHYMQDERTVVFFASNCPFLSQYTEHIATNLFIVCSLNISYYRKTRNY
jgi:hypothetical protein